MSTKAIAPAESTPDPIADLMRLAVEKGPEGVDALERIVAMRERDRDWHAEQDFNGAMGAAQAEMGRISTDANNPQTRSRYASYGKLDKALRPIYTSHGFALSFDTVPGDSTDVLLVRCFVSHSGGHTRTYQIPMDATGKGAKGGDVMTRTHATGSAASYGMRYLLKLIFNVAIGEEDDDGAGAGQPDEETITEEQAATLAALADEVGADTVKFLKWAGVDRFNAIKLSRYEKCVRGLEAKR